MMIKQRINPYLFCSAIAAVLGRRENEALIFVTFYQEKVERNRTIIFRQFYLL
jgi:hypothetical protein